MLQALPGCCKPQKEGLARTRRGYLTRDDAIVLTRSHDWMKIL